MSRSSYLANEVDLAKEVLLNAMNEDDLLVDRYEWKSLLGFVTLLFLEGSDLALISMYFTCLLFFT